MIDKDTKLYGSFSANAGSFGCAFHNAGFACLGINAIYKSFSITSIEAAVAAMKTLGIQGAGVSAPFKQEVLQYVDSTSMHVQAIGATNTLLNMNGKIHADNTDWYAIWEYLNNVSASHIYILGNGGYSKAAQYACSKMGKPFTVITRSNWSMIDELRNSVVFNATPVKNITLDSSNLFIDCHTDTQSGRKLASLQGSIQFQLYTGYDYPSILL